jgi:RNase P/RNase MRP subunit POP5
MVRIKYRYFLGEVKFKGKTPEFGCYQLLHQLRDEIQKLFGDFGLSAVLKGLQVKYYNSGTNIFILRSPREHRKMVEDSILGMKHFFKVEGEIKILHVGGTMKMCQRAGARYDQQLLETEENEEMEV